MRLQMGRAPQHQGTAEELRSLPLSSLEYAAGQQGAEEMTPAQKLAAELDSTILQVRAVRTALRADIKSHPQGHETEENSTHVPRKD